MPEAEALTGVPAKIIRAQVRNGLLKARMAGSTTMRIRRADLDEWLDLLCSALCGRQMWKYSSYSSGVGARRAWSISPRLMLIQVSIRSSVKTSPAVRKS